MKTLLQINSVINISSTGRIAEEIGLLALQNGWDSYLAYGRNARPSQSKLIRIGNDVDIALHGIQTRLFDRHGLGSIGATKRFIRQIEDIRPDVIHFHNLHGYYLNIEILFQYLSGTTTPVVWSVHDCWPVTGHCAYFDFVGCDKWKTECNRCPQKKTYPASYFLDRSRQNYYLKKKLFTLVENLTIVPTCNWMNDIVRQSYLSAYPARILHNGINTTVFKPSDTPTIRHKYNLMNTFIILGVANPWSQRKGLKDFIQLSKHLADNSKIILLGLNKRQIENLPPGIIGLGKTETINELADFYSTADVFINPTWEDNFPTTNLESLACGTPVITYNTGGSVESVSEKTGFIVEKGDITGLLSAVETVRRRGKKHYTSNCVFRARREFDMNDRYNDYLELYEDLIR